MKTVIQYLICCKYGDWDDARTIPVLVAQNPSIAQDVIKDLEGNPQSEYLKMIEEYDVPSDACYSMQPICTLTDEPKDLLTKDELVQKLKAGTKMEDLFDFCPGQECDIFKTTQLIPGDKIIYIPDLNLNKIPTDRPAKDAEEIQWILGSCYTGDEFLEDCDNNWKKAEELFCYCDWLHPSSALPEIDNEDE